MTYLQKGVLAGLLSVLLSALLFFGGAAQTATVGDVSGLACQDGYALWAQETNGPQNHETILWSGSETDVGGKFRSNGSIHISGSSNSVSGAVEYGSSFVDGGDDNVFGATVQVSPSEMPVAYDLDDYRPGGVVAQRAQAEGRYHLISSKFEVSDQGTQLDGLYYVQGRVEISASDVHGEFTIVTENKVEIGGSDLDVEPYADGLLFFTDSPGEKNFEVSGSNSLMRGIIYAPRVGIELSGSSNTFEGAIYVAEAKLPGSSLHIDFDGAHCPQEGDQTSTPPPGPTVTPTQPPTATSTPSLTPTPTNTGTPGPSPTPTATSTPGPPPQHGFYLPLALHTDYRGPGEPNNSCQEAHGLVVDLTQQFLAEDRDDWYYVELQSGGDLTVQLTNFIPQQGQVALYRGQSCETLVFLENNGNTSTAKTIAAGDQPAGRYYVYVSNDGPLNDSDFYELQISVDAPQQ